MVSTSIQAVRDALQSGLSFFRKSNQEITIGIRPDRFVDYVQNASALHRLGRDVRTLNLFLRATAMEQISNEDVGNLSPNRQRLVHTVSRLSRDGSFRQQVLNAYGNRCAVTRMQLRLVDAAHILPVGAPGSVDNVRNGLALSPTYHRAYDNGLIYLDQDYTMRINRAGEQGLRDLRLVGGLENFRASLGRILLPPDRRQWPNRNYIQRANAFRRITPGGE
jgi:putative restriction endonuclease